MKAPKQPKEFTVKKVLAISDVVPLISTATSIFSNDVQLKDGTWIHLTQSFLRIVKIGQPLECCMCGCMATHIQRHVENEGKSVQADTWRFMAWNKKHNRPTFLTVDHIVPKYYGGTLSSENIRIACRDCNSERGRSIKDIEHLNIVSREAYSFDKARTFIQKQLKDIIQLTKNRIEHFKNVVRNFLTSKSQSYRKAKDKNSFREAIKRGLKSIGYKGLDPTIINQIVEAGAFTL